MSTCLNIDNCHGFIRRFACYPTHKQQVSGMTETSIGSLAALPVQALRFCARPIMKRPF
jgi:hypothetical protein